MTTAGKVKLVVGVLIVTLLVIVFFQNGDPVRFKFLFFDAIEIAKTLLILGSMILGSVATLLVQLFWRQRKRVRAAQDLGARPQP